METGGAFRSRWMLLVAAVLAVVAAASLFTASDLGPFSASTPSVYALLPPVYLVAVAGLWALAFASYRDGPLLRVSALLWATMMLPLSALLPYSFRHDTHQFTVPAEALAAGSDVFATGFLYTDSYPILSSLLYAATSLGGVDLLSVLRASPFVLGGLAALALAVVAQHLSARSGGVEDPRRALALSLLFVAGAGTLAAFRFNFTPSALGTVLFLVLVGQFLSRRRESDVMLAGVGVFAAMAHAFYMPLAVAVGLGLDWVLGPRLSRPRIWIAIALAVTGWVWSAMLTGLVTHSYDTVLSQVFGLSSVPDQGGLEPSTPRASRFADLAVPVFVINRLLLFGALALTGWILLRSRGAVSARLTVLMGALSAVYVLVILLGSGAFVDRIVFVTFCVIAALWIREALRSRRVAVLVAAFCLASTTIGFHWLAFDAITAQERAAYEEVSNAPEFVAPFDPPMVGLLRDDPARIPAVDLAQADLKHLPPRAHLRVDLPHLDAFQTYRRTAAVPIPAGSSLVADLGDGYAVYWAGPPRA